MDDRAQAIEISRLFLGLLVGAVVFWVVDSVAEPLLDIAGESGSGEVAAQGTSYMTEGVAFLPVVFLFISFFGLIAYSVFSRQVLGP